MGSEGGRDERILRRVSGYVYWTWAGEWMSLETGAGAACEDDAFHDFYLSRYDFHKTMELKYLNCWFKDLGVD